jgi:putative addiction module component (TIGR02574 family)
MAMPIEVLEAEVLGLAPMDRARLLDKLLASLEQEPAWQAEWNRAWADEADRREAEISAGRSAWIPAEEAVARLRARLK